MKDSDIFTASSRATWIEVNSSALRNNVRTLKAQLSPPTRLMAVIKANAYGHDARLVAPVVAQAGADWLAVATPGEGLELRHHGIRAPILILGYTPPWMIRTALAAQLTLTVDSMESIAAVAQVAQTMGHRARVHLKVNTGMNRLGLRPHTVAPALTAMQQHAAIVVEGIFTHFATADNPATPFFAEQAQRFHDLIAQLNALGLRPPLVHAANSAATINAPDTHYDIVRCGIALYGLHPDEQSTPLPPTLQPVLSWKAQIVHVTALKPGEGVGYGQTYIAERATTIATIPIGYADGFPRSPQNWHAVLIHGQEAPLVGRVCMDQTMVDVGHLLALGQEVHVGDEVVLIGHQGERSLTAETIGRRTGTINYEVVSRILPRVPRILI